MAIPDKGYYECGPFTVDPRSRVLVRRGRRIRLPESQLNLLLSMLEKDDNWTRVKSNILLAAAGATPVASETLADDFRELNETLVDEQLETVLPDKTAIRERIAWGRSSNVASVLWQELEPYVSFIVGQAGLESHTDEGLLRAVKAFTRALEIDPHLADAHVGMANACLLCYQTTLTDLEPSRPGLERAWLHARAGAGADPVWAHARATRATVALYADTWVNAFAGAMDAVSMEPGEWRHHLRLAVVAWGSERMKAASRAQQLCPLLPVANWLIGTVLIASQDWAEALLCREAGAALQQTLREGNERFAGVGLHLLYGLVLAARGDVSRARTEFEREIAGIDCGHVHGRDTLADAWYARGALALRESARDDARVSFQRALEIMPAHGLAMAGLAAVSGGTVNAALHGGGPLYGATVQAVILTLQGRHEQAAQLYADALGKDRTVGSGWELPVEPLLNVSAHRAIWEKPLRIIRNGALCM